MADPTVLSPAAKAVLNAVVDGAHPAFAPIAAPMAAAALRAVADQCKLERNYHPDYPETESVVVVSDLLAIATELENQ